jgi:hypothetical protein
MMLPIIPAIRTALYPQIRTLIAVRKATRVFLECLLGERFLRAEVSGYC